MGFVLYVFSRVGSSSLVINVRGGVTRSFGILNLGVRASVDPEINLMEEEVWGHSYFL